MNWRLEMSRQKIKIRFININGDKMVMDIYRSLLGTIYKALRDDSRIFDITIGGTSKMSYQEYVRQYGGLVVPA